MSKQTIDGVPRDLLSDVFDELPDWATPAATRLSAQLDAPEPLWSPHLATASLSALLLALAKHGVKASGGIEDQPWVIEPAALPQGDAVPVSAYWSDWSMVTLEIEGRHRTYVECGKPQVEPVVPEPTYRLLGDGDIIQEGDETLNDDTATWGRQPPGVFLGMPYNRRVMQPVRRATS